MIVLGLDTSTATGSAAIVRDGQLVGERVWGGEARHAEHVLPELAALLREVGLAPGEVELLAVGVGPGSFTGVRIGMATMKGLALADGTPLVGVSSLAVLARGVVEDAGPAATAGGGVAVLTLGEASKGEVFAALYLGTGSVLTVLEPPFHGLPADVRGRVEARLAPAALPAGSLLLVGGGLRRVPEAFRGLGREVPPAADVPRGHWVAALGATRFRETGQTELLELEPEYIRGSDATLPAVPLKTVE